MGKKEEIADIVRDTLITKYGYQAEGNYVRKPISNNYAIGFYHNTDDPGNPLSICITHREGTGFSPTQRSTILEVLNRREFTNSYSEPGEGDSSDGRAEIWSALEISKFSGFSNQDIANWIVLLFEHFVTTVGLLELT